jgi:hypothetical protein
MDAIASNCGCIPRLCSSSGNTPAFNRAITEKKNPAEAGFSGVASAMPGFDQNL